MSSLNIEACRQPWESDEHWSLRKEFLVRFQPKFDVDRLLCLAQVYTNVELLGCSYPAPLMIQIRELAKELQLGTDLQQTRKARQNIPFVKEKNGGPAKRAILRSATAHPPQVQVIKLPDADAVSKNLEINSNQFATSKQSDVSKGGNNLNICTNQSPGYQLSTIKKPMDEDSCRYSFSSEEATGAPTPETICSGTPIEGATSDVLKAEKEHQSAVSNLSWLSLSRPILSKATRKKLRRDEKAFRRDARMASLQPAFKFVSDGKNLTMKIDEEQTATSSANKQSSMPKVNNGPDMDTDQSPVPRIETVKSEATDGSSELGNPSSTDNSLAEKFEKIIEGIIASKSRPHVFKGKNTQYWWLVLLRLCQRLRYKFSYDVSTDRSSQFTITLKVLDVILTKVTDSSEDLLKGKAAKIALETLLHPAFKIVSDGENLIAKIDEEQTAMSSANEQSSMPKGDNNPDIGTNQLSVPTIEASKSEDTDSFFQLDNSPSTDSIFAEKLQKIQTIVSEIRPGILYGENIESRCCFALDRICQKLRYSFLCDIRKEKNSQFTCTLRVHDVILAKVTSITRKKLKSVAVRKAVETLLHPGLKIVSDGEDLILEEDKTQTQIHPEQSFESKVFPLDPNLQYYFCILDGDGSVSASPASILNRSAAFCKIGISFDVYVNYHGPSISYMCEISLHGHKICQVPGVSKEEAKTLAGELALNILSKVVYSIKVNNDILDDEFVVSRDQLYDCSDSSTILTETNVGCKMLKMMGWSGGGIGKEGNTGIVEPIKASLGLQRGQGLGYSGKYQCTKTGKMPDKPFRAKIESLLLEYAKSNSFKDLVFATDFSPEERKYIHKLAKKYKLKSVSRGSNQARQLTVGRYLFPQELLSHLQMAGGSFGKYTLITPQQYIEEHSKDILEYH